MSVNVTALRKCKRTVSVNKRNRNSNGTDYHDRDGKRRSNRFVLTLVLTLTITLALRLTLTLPQDQHKTRVADRPQLWRCQGLLRSVLRWQCITTTPTALVWL